MPTENATGEKLLLFSSTLSIPSSSFCPSVSSSPSALSIISSFFFPFFLLLCISVSSPSDSSHDNGSFLESWLSIPASFSNATVIHHTSFLNLLNSLRPSNFLKISAFHSVSICCFDFLTFDLLAVFVLAFAYALLASKGLQATLALAHGAHEVVWL